MAALRSSNCSAVLLIGCLALAQVAAAQSAWADASLTECDRLAAAPTDPNKISSGVSFSELDASLAVPACEDALRAFPSSDRITFQLARALNKANRFDEAISLYSELAATGYPIAMYNLSGLYMGGTGVEKNEAKAIELLQGSAEAGYGLAQYELGLFYATGQHVEKNLDKAVHWYERGSEQGEASAQNELGWFYRNGIGVQANLDRVIDLFRKSAAGGNALAQYNLGLLYLEGQGVPQRSYRGRTLVQAFF